MAPHFQGDISVGSVASDLSYPAAANFDWAGTNSKIGSLRGGTGKISDSSLAMNLQ